MDALVFDIYRGTSHDGPGQRTTVFFQGCSLRCAWCHNPEGIAPHPQVWWDSRACIGCGECHDVCPSGANRMEPEGISIDRTLCTRCGSCADACPTQAMRFTSDRWSLEKLVREAQKDLAYYRKTGGGVTASGGECMMQSDFVAAFFAALQEQGIDTALDTCGNVSWERFEAVLPHTDHVLYDLKIADSSLHRRWTGAGNEQILSNLRRIVQAKREGKTHADIWIRTPLIPGATDSAENIRAIGQFLAAEVGDCLSCWEMPAFNNSCISKYTRLGQRWEFTQAPMITREQADMLLETAKEALGNAVPVRVTGLLATSLQK